MKLNDMSEVTNLLNLAEVSLIQGQQSIHAAGGIIKDNKFKFICKVLEALITITIELKREVNNANH